MAAVSLTSEALPMTHTPFIWCGTIVYSFPCPTDQDPAILHFASPRERVGIKQSTHQEGPPVAFTSVTCVLFEQPLQAKNSQEGTDVDPKYNG